MTVSVLTKPPGRPDESYVLPFMGGELWTIPTSNSVMRMVVTGQESKGDFAVITTGGTADQPIGFHFHKEAHDVFLCLKGSINVWADDEARTLLPGDFASVPPGTIHQYQILGAHSEFVGLIVPGGWEEFFRFVGEPYLDTNGIFPTKDNRNPMEVLVPKLIAATEKFDMIPKRDHVGAVDGPVYCRDELDNKLPDDKKAYFLKADAGPRWASSGFLIKPLARLAQTDGKFAIARVEATKGIVPSISNNNNNDDVNGKTTLVFPTSHHAFLIDQGSFTFIIGENNKDSSSEPSEIVATSGETVFIPAGFSFSFSAVSRHAAAYVFTNGDDSGNGGLVELLIKKGSLYAQPIISEDFPTLE